MRKLVSKDDLTTELEKKHEQIEADLQRALDDKHAALVELEMECDEARQRGLKGNLIVSSPKRVLADGTSVDTLAVRRTA